MWEVGGGCGLKTFVCMCQALATWDRTLMPNTLEPTEKLGQYEVVVDRMLHGDF